MQLFYFYFFKLFIFIINQRHALYSVQCWARYLKKKKSYITSYFSQTLTELHRCKINELPGKVTIVT